MEYAVVTTINGGVREYFCANIADAEALQDVLAKQGIECKVVFYEETKNGTDPGTW